MGTAQLGNLFRATTDEESTAAVETAWAAGVRYFDTAPHYGLGLAERRLGRALAGRAREDFVVSTKVGRLLVDDLGEDRPDDEGFAVSSSIRRAWDFSRDGVLRSIESSLERLGLDRIDIALLHDPDDHWAEASSTGVAALMELRDQGVIGAVGAGMNQAELLTRFVLETDVDVVMCAGRYTLLDRRAADHLLPAAVERGVGVIAAGVYNSGVLSSDRPDANTTFDYSAAPDAVLTLTNRMADVCEQAGVRLPEAAVQFPEQHPSVISTVLGLRTSEQVVAAAARMAVRIPPSVWADLDAIASTGPGQASDRSGR